MSDLTDRIDAALAECATRDWRYEPKWATDVAALLREARAALPEPPSDDEREALATVIDRGMQSTYVPWAELQEAADAILAADYRRPGPVTDAEVEAAATVLHALYDKMYDASHLSWLDFAEDARAALEAAREARSS